MTLDPVTQEFHRALIEAGKKLKADGREDVAGVVAEWVKASMASGSVTDVILLDDQFMRRIIEALPEAERAELIAEVKESPAVKIEYPEIGVVPNHRAKQSARAVANQILRERFGLPRPY